MKAHTFYVTDRNDNVLADFGTDLLKAMRFVKAKEGPPGKRTPPTSGRRSTAERQATS